MDVRKIFKKTKLEYEQLQYFTNIGQRHNRNRTRSRSRRVSVQKQFIKHLSNLADTGTDHDIWVSPVADEMKTFTSTLMGTEYWKQALDVAITMTDPDYYAWQVYSFPIFLNWFEEHGDEDRDGRLFFELVTDLVNK